ncbi:MAG: hypothetical protein ACYS1A_18555, partial [Planctomycetota bacterium]
MAKGKRGWQPRELRLVSEYLAAYHPHGIKMERVRLGSIHPGFNTKGMDAATKRMFIQFNRWADAVVILPEKIVLIEVTIPPRPQKVAQLEMYEQLIPTTPEFELYLDRPIEKVLVMAVRDITVEQFARQKGIKVVVFRPKWINDYLSERSKRYSAPSMSGS